MVILSGTITNNIGDNFGDGWFTEEMAESILEKISKSVAKSVRDSYSIQAGAAARLKKLVNELSECYRDEKDQISKIANKTAFYTSQGWSEFIYQKNKSASYEKIFKICSEVLDILRTGGMEKPLQLVVYSTDSTGTINKVYYGEETKAAMKVAGSENEIQYIKDEVSLKMRELSEENLLVKHYNNFRRGINTNHHLLEVREKIRDNKINEGHVIEAFQRHLYFQHKIHSINENTFNDLSLVEDPIPSKFIAINLYYAINNDPWWSGGDVGNMQVKADNLRLASIKSIEAVATKILEMMAHYKTFSAKNFKEMFTQGELDRMVRQDPSRVGQKTIKELCSIIASKSAQLEEEL